MPSKSSDNRVKVVTEYYSKIINNIRKLIIVEKTDIYVLVIYSVFVGLFGLVVPVAVSSLVSTLAFGSLIQPLVILSLLIILFLGINSVFRILQSYTSEYLERRIFARTMLTLSTLFSSKRIKYPSYRAEFTNRIFDLVTVQKSFTDLATNGVFSVMGGLIGMIIVAFYHPFFLVYNIIIVFFAIYAVTFRFHRRGIETSFEVSNKKYDSVAWLQEIARHEDSFQTDWGEQFASDKMLSEVDKYLNARKSHFSIFIRQSIGYYMVQVFAGAMLLGLGGYVVTINELSIGQFVAAELILAKVLDGLIDLPKYLEKWYDLTVGWQKVNKLLDLKEKEIAQDADEINLKKKLNFSRNKVLYFTEEELTVNALLFMRYVERKQEGKQVLLLEKNELFAGSLYANIALSEYRDETEIDKVIEQMGLERWLTHDLLKREIFTYGEGFSLQEIGKILLLRAIIMKPEVLILSNFLENFNLVDEQTFLKVFLRNFSGNTIIVERAEIMPKIRKINTGLSTKKSTKVVKRK